MFEKIMKSVSWFILGLLATVALVSILYKAQDVLWYQPNYAAETQWMPKAVFISNLVNDQASEMSWTIAKLEYYDHTCWLLQRMYNNYRRKLWIEEQKAPPYTNLLQQVKELVCMERTELMYLNPQPTGFLRIEDLEW